MVDRFIVTRISGIFFPERWSSLVRYLYRSRLIFLLLGLALNFMAHGNFVNSLLGRVLAGQISNPIKDFISRNFEVAEHLGQVGGSSQVMLETLAEKTFEPALLIKGENRESAKDPWPEKGWDAERYKFCDNLLRGNPKILMAA